MAWPAQSGVATGFTVEQVSGGTTVLMWGSEGMLATINSKSVSFAIVSRFSQRKLVENIELTNGTGLITNRVRITDGVQWDLTVRDDTRIASAALPTVGQAVTVVDGAGMLGTQGTAYAGTVVDSGYEAAPKQAGERTLVIENLVLIEAQP